MDDKYGSSRSLLTDQKPTQRETAAFFYITTTREELLPFSASGHGGGISSHAKTYVINVCSAACSICASVFLASPYSLCQHSAAEGLVGVNRESETGRKTLQGSASTRASALALRATHTHPGCEEYVLLSLLQLSFFFRGGDEKQICSFHCCSCTPTALGALS